MNNNRRGSALLIVLGMLSFMVISAVGFSMYMRQSRAPSSYVRRNIATRYLVKAALANAIEDLEGNYNEEDGRGNNHLWGGRYADSYQLQNHFYGIYDDPYPGCGPDSREYPTDPRRNGDYWLKRVFCPFGPVMEPASNSDAEREWEYNPTVPTLTLEALAYLPPAIVDDVRKVSRLTRTACWRPLSYDSGRFAYTAVNVSDLFDINKLAADLPRDSSPNGRISLSTLCVNNAENPTSINMGNVSTLRNAIEKWTSTSPDTPYVSLADFALCNAGSNYSPFSKFVGGTAGSLLDGINPMEANALFITDTWFPPTNKTGQVVYDLAGQHQPFKPGALKSGGGAANSFLEVLLQRNPQDNAGEIFEKNLGIGLACLYDYLDSDSYPISLCLPTTEAVPMVVGVSAPVGLQPTIGQIGDANGHWKVPGVVNKADGTQEPAEAEVNRTCKKMGITSFGNQAIVKVLTAFPFKRMAASRRKTSFQVRGLMRVCLAKPGMRSRISGGACLLPTARSTWQNGVANGVATFISEPQTVSFSSDCRRWEDAVNDQVTLNFNNLNVQMPLYWQVEEAYGVITPSTGAFVPNDPAYAPRQQFNSLGVLSQEPATLRPLNNEGGFYDGWTANGPWNLDQYGENGVKDMSSQSFVSEPFRLQVSLWIQVLDGNEVVDMVPACVNDDNEWCNASLPDNNDIGQKCGGGVPLLGFTSSTDIKFDNLQATISQPIQYQDYSTLYAVDPRYNFAPEDWYASTDLQVSKPTWHDNIKNNYLGKNGRDRDIFMFVSDQDYLQDIGELQFLPYLQDMNGNASFLGGDYSPNFHGRPFTERIGPVASGSGFANGGRFWRTYTAYDNGDGRDPIYALPYSGYPSGVRFNSGVSGFKLNPYSDDDRVLFAALVGTPYDYYIASSNVDSQVKKVQNIDISQMMNTYSFGQSSVARLSDDELQDIASEFRDEFQSFARNGRSDWESGWNNLQWQEDNASRIADDNRRFFGVDLSESLHQVDRKFLYSYWRECFGNRQQLFLIFVRAEPTSIGGGASGSISSAQLGGRAVALVWRDPTMPSKNKMKRHPRSDFRGSGESVKKKFREMKRDTPSHQTRVLFYHQFD